MSLIRQFLLIDALAFVVIAGAFIYVGVPEAILGVAAGYLLGLQTGGADGR